MNKSGNIVYSKNIFLSEEADRFAGFIVMKDQRINQLIHEAEMDEETLKKLKNDYEFFDCKDSYIFPGIIDINVHLNSTCKMKEF